MEMKKNPLKKGSSLLANSIVTFLKKMSIFLKKLSRENPKNNKSSFYVSFSKTLILFIQKLFKKLSVKNFHSHLASMINAKWVVLLPISLNRLYEYCSHCYLQVFNAVFNKLQGGLVYA